VDQTTEKAFEPKSGFFTTEFWKSFIYAGISIATGLGAIGPNVPAKYATVIDSAAFIAGAICVAVYTLSRGKTKAAATQATADVINVEKQLDVTRQINHLPKTPSGRASKSAGPPL